MKAVLRYNRISPKKVNLVAGLVRKKSVIEALDILKFTNKSSAPVLAKVIKSAAANAKNNFKQKEENLYVEEIVVTEGPTLKRHMPVSRGRAHPILKRTSHITVKIGVSMPSASKVAKTPKVEEQAEAIEAKEEAPKVKTTVKKSPAKKKTTKKES